MNTTETVLKLACKIFKDNSLVAASALQDASGYDSMEHVQFLVELEDAFGVEIQDTEVLRNTTIQEVVALIHQKQ